MPLKGSKKTPKVAPKRHVAAKPPEPDFDPAYEGAYGRSDVALERRAVGTQPNSRARSAVERAEARMAAQSPAAVKKRKQPQMPGMDVNYNADVELDRERSVVRRAAPRRAEVADEYDPDSLGEGEEIIETKGQESQRAKMPRMEPVGRNDAQRTSRIPGRNEYGRIQAYNRAGKLISRTHYATSDKFDVPLHFIPDGWTYQWLSQATVGQANNNAHFFANGWEPVMSKRHDGVFMQKGHDGPIIVDGMLLVERPVQLTLEARAEELKAAKSLMRTQNEQFQPKMPGARSSRYRGTELRIKRELEEMPDEMAPRLVVDDGSYENV
jgi:hypothetical protein